MKIDVIPYEPAHAYAILDRNVREQDLWLSSYPDWEKWTKGWKDGGPAHTLIIEDEIVACGGVVLLEWKRGEAWTLLSSLFYKYPKTVFRLVRDNLNRIIQEHDLRRVQALVKPDFITARNFMMHLGFQNEGLLKAFGPRGEDLLMFARII